MVYYTRKLQYNPYNNVKTYHISYTQHFVLLTRDKHLELAYSTITFQYLQDIIEHIDNVGNS